MKIHEKIKNLREEHNLTQEAFAKKLDISLNALKNYEDKDLGRIPNSDVLLRISERFNVSTDYLLHDEITNKHYNNIKIGEELSLTDESINKIENLNNCNISGTDISLSSTFNHTLQNLNLSDFVLNIELVKQLDYIVYSVLDPIIHIFEDKKYINKQIKNNQINNLKPIFDKIELLNMDISKRFEKYKFFITYYSGYDFSLRDMKHSFNELKHYLFSEKQNNTLKDYDLNDYIDDYLTDIEEIIRRLEGCIRIFKNGINEEIYSYLTNIKIENKEKSVQEWRDIYGSARNSKK